VPVAGDADADGVCDDTDLCTGDDATGDADADGVCDDTDLCTGDDATGDADADGICDDTDLCAGDDATGDADADGVCDDTDLCAGDDATGDADADGVCDDTDLCTGDDATGDADADGICDDLDDCYGDNASGDTDADGICDDLDACDGPGALADNDYDDACGDADLCLGHDTTGDSDGDGICDDIVPCDDPVVAPGTDCTVPSPVPRNTCAGAPIHHEVRHTGYVACPDGSINRLWSSRGWLLPVTDSTHWVCDDVTCNAAPEGACPELIDAYGSFASCTFGCDEDADCQTGQACLPPGVSGFWPGHPIYGRGTCITASCSASDDCATGECGYDFSVILNCGLTRPHLMCRTPQDECRTWQDCAGGAYDYPCDPSHTGVRVCEYSDDSCGRPLVDAAGEGHTAPTVQRNDWCTHVEPDAPTDDVLAAHWRKIGLLEHASIASFARHMLELLHLGAPAHLIAEVAPAQADEVTHAELVFGLAARFGDGPVGPGALDVSQTMPRSEVHDIFDGLVLEGCIGETVSAAEAAICTGRCTDPATRSILRQIARDEARHAALAWKTAAWMQHRFPHLAGRLDALVADARKTTGPVVSHPRAADGLFSRSERQALRQRMLRDVIGAHLLTLPSPTTPVSTTSRVRDASTA
jgi:hypothetical protein